jgi:hypothetical protein
MIDQVAFDVAQDDPSVDSTCTQAMTGACAGEPFFREIEGKRYCVLHLPDVDKKRSFRFGREEETEISGLQLSTPTK